MIQVNGERYRVVRLACGYLFRLKPERTGVAHSGDVFNYDQIRALVKTHDFHGEKNAATGKR